MPVCGPVLHRRARLPGKLLLARLGLLPLLLHIVPSAHVPGTCSAASLSPTAKGAQAWEPAAALARESSAVAALLLPGWHAGEWFEAKAQPGHEVEPLDEQRDVVVGNLWKTVGACSSGHGIPGHVHDICAQVSPRRGQRQASWQNCGAARGRACPWLSTFLGSAL